MYPVFQLYKSVEWPSHRFPRWSLWLLPVNTRYRLPSIFCTWLVHRVFWRKWCIGAISIVAVVMTGAVLSLNIQKPSRWSSLQCLLLPYSEVPMTLSFSWHGEGVSPQQPDVWLIINIWNDYYNPFRRPLLESYCWSWPIREPRKPTINV